MKQTVRLGEALVNAGLIDDFQLQSALGQQRQWGGRIGKALIDLGFLDEATIVKFLSEKMNFPAIDLSRSRIAAQTFEALPKQVAEKYITVPILIKNTPGKKTLVLAMTDPTDLRAIDEIEFVTNFKIEPVVAIESAIKKVLDFYGEEHVGGAPEQKGIVMEDQGPTRVEVVQGEMDMLDEVRKAQGQPEAETAIPSAVIEGEEELDFRSPPLEAFEAEDVPVEDDTPLEMVAEEIEEPEEDAVETIEDAEVIEDIEPVEEAVEVEDDADAAPVTVGPAQGADPSEYNVATVTEDDEEIPGAVEPDAIAEVQPAEEAESVAVVQSIEELEAITTGKAARPPEDVADAETAEAVEVVETAEEIETPEETEFVETIEAAEAPEEIDTAEEITTVDTVEETEAVEEAEAIEDTEEIDAAEEIKAAEAVDETAEVVETAIEVETPTAFESHAEAEDMASLRAEVAGLTQKIEGLVALFMLRGEGKISPEEFIEELRKL